MKTNKNKLTKYEQDILDSMERGEWVPVSDEESEIKRHRQLFQENLKNAMISLRVNSSDLGNFKEKAKESGIPYQTLLTTLMKQYTEGKIKIEI